MTISLKHQIWEGVKIFEKQDNHKSKTYNKFTKTRKKRTQAKNRRIHQTTKRKTKKEKKGTKKKNHRINQKTRFKMTINTYLSRNYKTPRGEHRQNTL